MKNDILQSDWERAVPADSSPSPFSAAVRLAADWLAGVGFLRFHAAAYAIAGAALLLIDLILNPSDPWAIDVLRVWLILLGSHAVGLIAAWVTWRAIRPHRLVEIQRVWSDSEDDELVEADTAFPAGPPRPLPATGRFTPGRVRPDADADDEQGWLNGVLAALGDAVLELGDLARAGGIRIRRGMSRVFDWIQGDEEEIDAEEVESTLTPEPRRAQPTAPRSPARWVVPTGSGRKGADPTTQPDPGPVAAQRPPAPIVPMPRPAQTSATPPANEHRSDAAPAPGARPAEPTPLTPRPAKRREVSG